MYIWYKYTRSFRLWARKKHYGAEDLYVERDPYIGITFYNVFRLITSVILY
jgi:hypothetical protein